MSTKYLPLLFVFLTLGSIHNPSKVQAQLIPDTTLGTENSIVTPQQLRDLIEGGAIRGDNLFHSFSEFNVNEGQSVYFANPQSILNIFTRITGTNPSDIFGTLGVDGAANLILINPNGIHFGENASLDISGSFFATTADSVIFNNGFEFSASNPEAPPLLTVNLTPGLQLGSLPQGEITNFGDLGVGLGENLTLYGTEITSTGNLTAPGGTVQVLGDAISLLNNAQIDVSSPTGGGIVRIGGDFQGQGILPTAKRVYIDTGVNINADALTSGDGGVVIIWSDEVTGFYGNITARGASSITQSNGGLVEVSGKEHLIFRGNVDTSAVNGLPGTLLLDPINIVIANGSGDEAGDGTDSFAGNNSGTVGSILSAPLSEFDDNAPTTIYESELEGLSGDNNIILQATNDITLQDLADDSLSLSAGSGLIALSADADGDGIGSFVMEDMTDTIFTNGRDIAISGASLILGSIDTTPTISGGELIATVDIDAGGAIPETGTMGTAIFTFTVPDIGEGISNLDVRFSAAHTFDSDLDVSLESPAGTILELFNGVGGGNDNFQDTLLDDSSDISIADGSAPFNGTFRPTGEGGLVVFNGENTAGVWTLTVNDNASFDSGELFRSGDAAPWGTAIGTQLLFKSPVIATGGNAGAISLNATNGDLSAVSLNTGVLDGEGGDINLLAEGNIQLENLDSSGGIAGGNIDITSINGSVLIDNGSLNSETNSSGNSGNIGISGDSISLSNGTTISTTTFGAGLGGIITITSDGEVSFDNSSLFAQTTNTGDAGGINITADSVTLSNDTSLSVSTFGSGNAGNISIESNGAISLINDTNLFSNVQPGGTGKGGIITIQSNSLSLVDGSQIQTLVREDSGTLDNLQEGGSVFINVQEGVTITGTNDSGFSSGILSDVEAGSIGNGGDIEINTTSLSLSNSGFLSTDISVAGEGGDINIFGNSISLSNGALISSTTFGEGLGGNISIFSDGEVSLDNSSLFTQTTDTGDAGDININAGSVTLSNDTVLDVSTFGSGDAGNISIESNGAVSLINDTNLFSNVESEGTGKGGIINIQSNSLSLVDGSQIQTLVREDSGTLDNLQEGGSVFINVQEGVNITGTNDSGFSSGILSDVEAGSIGNGGDIEINATSLSLSNSGFLSTDISVPGEGGDINIFGNNISLSSGALISSTTFGEGSGGNISIFSDGAFTVDNSRLSAQTEGLGDAGDINITAESVALSNETFISTTTFFGEGSGGNINITSAQEFNLNGSTLVTGTAGTGNSGSINIGAKSISIIGGIPIFELVNNILGITVLDGTNLVEEVAISTTTLESGEAGNITITSEGEITIENTLVGTISAGAGDAGDVEIRALEVNILNEGLIISDTRDSFFFNTLNTSDAGNIVINTERLLIQNTQPDSTELEATGISTSTTEGSIGNAGNIIINASDSIEIIGNQPGAINFDPLQPGQVLDLTSTATGIAAVTFGSGNAGTVEINTNNLTIRDGAGITTSLQEQSNGEGGDLRVNAAFINLQGIAGLVTTNLGSGNGGDVVIENAETIILQDGAAISTDTLLDASGDAGNLEIQTNQLSVFSGSRVGASTANSGDGGDVNINASEFVEVIGISEDSTIPSGIFTAALSDSTGVAGNLNIDTPLLTIQDGGEISASTSGTSIPGNITVENANSISLNNGTITTAVNADAVVDLNLLESGGNIELQTQSLNLTNNASILASTSGQGNAGQIQIPDANSIALDNSTITTAVNEGAIGEGGDIILQTEELTLTNQAQISAATASTGSAGEVRVEDANIVSLSDSIISSETIGEGVAGNIFLEGDNITLTEDAEVLVSSFSTQGGTIQLDGLTTLEVFNSRISASTESGEAGNVSVSASEFIILQGTLNDGTPGGLLAEATQGGQASNLTIITPSLTISDGSQATVSSTLEGRAGNLNIDSQKVQLNNFASISAETEAGSGGNINLLTLDILEVDDSTISASTIDGEAGNLDIQATQSVQLTGEGGLAVEATGVGSAGSLTINTPQLTLTDKAEISAATVSGVSEGVILENLTTLEVFNSRISASTESGEAGNVSVSASEFIILQGTLNDATPGGLIAEATQGGQASNLTIITPSLTISDGSQVTVSSTLEGTAGSLNIDSQKVQLNNQARITAETEAGSEANINLLTLDTLEVNESTISASTIDGQAGNISVNANESVKLQTGTIAVAATGSGFAGELTINTPQLTLTEDSEISATTASGREGNISLENLDTLEVNNSSITASTVNGEAGDINVNANESVKLQTGTIAVEATGAGSAGSIIIDTPQLTLTEEAEISATTVSGVSESITLENLTTLEVFNSRISASTESGEAGNVSVNASDFIIVQGTLDDGIPGGLLAQATQGGQANNLTIITPSLTISDGSQVTVSSPQGQAGNLEITSNNISLNNGEITAETGLSSPEGGANITLEIAEFLFLENQSLISATANNAANGGNVTINAEFIIAPPSPAAGSDIAANAFEGNGGMVTITTDGLFGIAFQPSDTPFNDITASSEFGSAGIVEILQPNVDPAQSITALPINLVDASRLIVRSCPTDEEALGRFVVTGRGGLPANPRERLSDEILLDEWISLSENRQSQENVNILPPESKQQIIEARGWSVGANGKIILTAEAVAETVGQNQLEAYRCFGAGDAGN